MSQIEYLNAINATPTVSFQYNDPLGRMTQMTDGPDAAVTQYTYWPIATPGQTVLGGGRLKEITRPNLPNPATHTIHLDYDALGRVWQRSIGGAANVEQLTFDLGRLTSVTNNLGTFLYSYEGNTDRLAAVSYPNGQQTTYSYGPAAQDFRLAQIKNLGVPAAPGAAAPTLSQFDYTYDVAGRITTWAQRDTGQPAGRAWIFGYDAADQLTSGWLRDLATNADLKALGYDYDFAGNRTLTVEDGTTKPVAVNEYNQAFHGATSGWMEIRGQVSERADVRINGKPVEKLQDTEAGGFRFRALVQAQVGENNYRLQGTELNAPANSKVQTFNRTLRLDVPPTGITSYDLNGNMVNNGAGQIYHWDAENRLVKIEYAGTNRKTLFQYDGLSRRVSTTEMEGDQVIEGHISLWYGTSIAENRSFSNLVQTRYFDEGEQRVGGANPGNYYYTTDHLGSIRELTDTTGLVRARYDYDPYGNRTKVSGDVEAAKGFTGFPVHTASRLEWALYRAYDPGAGRWISRDPIEEEGGINLYAYVANSPLLATDPLGLLDVDYTGNNPVGPSLRAIPDKPHSISVGGHGSPYNIEDDRGRRSRFLGSDDVSKDLEANPKYSAADEIWLYSCSTGRGRNPIAQKIANRTGKKVMAPDDLLWAGRDGNYLVAPKDPNNKKTYDPVKRGKFVAFYPQEKKSFTQRVFGR